MNHRRTIFDISVHLAILLLLLAAAFPLLAATESRADGLEEEYVSSISYSSYPVYRFYNSVTSGHFFTISEEEKNTVINNYPQFHYEGVGFYAMAAQETGSLPVFRFFNATTSGHFFTINEGERDTVINSYPQFHYEGTGFFALTGPVSGALPVYRFFNAATSGHFFTISESEKNTVINNYPQFHYEGVGFYAFPSSTSSSTGSVKVTNGSATYSMTQLYLSSSSSPTWGSNLLTTSVGPGSWVTVTNVPAGTYDLKAVFSNGTVYTTYGFAVVAGSTTNITATPVSTGSVKVTNGSASYSITQLYLSLSSSSSWGPNQISSSVSPGGSVTVTSVPAGTYDLKAVFSNGGTYTTYGFAVVAGATTNITATTSSSTGSVKVTNGSASYSITQLYLSLSSSPTWGSNLLSTSVSPGGWVTVTGVTPGTYDLKVVFSNGSTYYAYGFAVTAGATTNITATTSSSTGSVKVTNGSASYSITQLYLSLSSSSTWGPDLLPSSVAPGGWVTVTGVTPGTYDLKVVFSNGAIYYAWGFAVTAGTTTNITAASGASTGSVKVTNGSLLCSMVDLYLSLSSSPTWGTDQLSSSIAVGGSYTITSVPPGTYDLKAVYSLSWLCSTYYRYGFSVVAGATTNITTN